MVTAAHTLYVGAADAPKPRPWSPGDLPLSTLPIFAPPCRENRGCGPSSLSIARSPSRQSAVRSGLPVPRGRIDSGVARPRRRKPTPRPGFHQQAGARFGLMPSFWRRVSTTRLKWRWR